MNKFGEWITNLGVRVNVNPSCSHGHVKSFRDQAFYHREMEDFFSYFDGRGGLYGFKEERVISRFKQRVRENYKKLTGNSRSMRGNHMYNVG